MVINPAKWCWFNCYRFTCSFNTYRWIICLLGCSNPENVNMHTYVYISVLQIRIRIRLYPDHSSNIRIRIRLFKNGMIRIRIRFFKNGIIMIQIRFFLNANFFCCCNHITVFHFIIARITSYVRSFCTLNRGPKIFLTRRS